MRHERLFLCGRSTKPGDAEYPGNAKVVPLLLWGTKANITLKISDITRRMVAGLLELFTDLLAIATYVYCADQATPRGGSGARDIGARWRRNLHFRIQVRRPDFWSRPEVAETLEEMLSFLSDDGYSFHFSELTDPPPVDTYLEFSEAETGFVADEIIPFSGGLDSLAGAIHEVFVREKRVALVSHRSAPKIAPKQKDLHGEIRSRCARDLKPLHIPVWIQKHGWDASDDSQRSRSFLYASLAASISAMFNKNRIRFYENGVTSLNLPIAEQLLGARATRTTHPRSIAGFQRLFSLMSNREFLVETPFLWMTKADVVNSIKDAGLVDLVKYAVSCSHVFAMTKLATHCGCCSQCIDRRLAVFGAECAEHDPKEMYKVDVFTGERSDEGQEIVLAESYIRTMREMADITQMQFFSRYGEVSRAVEALPGASDEVAEKIFQLYRRNGTQVEHAIKNAVTYYSDDLAKLSLPDRSLFRQLFGAKLPDMRTPKGTGGKGGKPVEGVTRKEKKENEVFQMQAALLKHHGFGTEAFSYEPATQKQLQKLTRWNQTKVHRVMRTIFGDDPMNTYKQKCKTKAITGFLKKNDDGSYTVEAVHELTDQ